MDTREMLRVVFEEDDQVRRDCENLEAERRKLQQQRRSGADLGLVYKPRNDAAVETDQAKWDDWNRWCDSRINSALERHRKLITPVIGAALSEIRFQLRKEIEHANKQGMISNLETATLRKEVRLLREELGSLRADFNVESAVRRSQVVDLPAYRKRNSDAA